MVVRRYYIPKGLYTQVRLAIADLHGELVSDPSDNAETYHVPGFNVTISYDGETGVAFGHEDPWMNDQVVSKLEELSKVKIDRIMPPKPPAHVWIDNRTEELLD